MSDSAAQFPVNGLDVALAVLLAHFNVKHSGTLSAGIGTLAGDTELLKLTHDEARELMRRPDSDDARAVIALARERFADRLENVAVN